MFRHGTIKQGGKKGSGWLCKQTPQVALPTDRSRRVVPPPGVPDVLKPWNPGVSPVDMLVARKREGCGEESNNSEITLEFSLTRGCKARKVGGILLQSQNMRIHTTGYKTTELFRLISKLLVSKSARAYHPKEAQ